MLLSSYRALDLTDPLGYLTGKILSDLGADVIKVEPPGGDPARLWPPVVTDTRGQRHGLPWMAQNAGKRSVTIDLQCADGRAQLLALACTADFLIESFTPGYLDGLGVGFSVLQQVNPRLIVVSITPFGQRGPWKDYRASDLELMATGGAMSLAGDREPMRVTLPQSTQWVGAEAAMGALTALLARHGTGRGQHVDVSAQAAVLAALAHAPAFWDLNRVNATRDGVYVTGRSVTGARYRAFWPVKDGWVNFIIYGGAAGRHTNQQLVDWMDSAGGAPDWLKAIDWKTFAVTGLTQAEVDRLEEPIYNFFLTITKREFYEGCVRRQMLGYPVATVADIHADPQLAAREFWQPVADPTIGRTIRFPGGFAIVDGQRLRVRGPAPTPGEHNRELLIKRSGGVNRETRRSGEEYRELRRSGDLHG